MKVDFFIIGTQKGGTTALHSILNSADGIEMSSPKEVHFFDNESIDWLQPDYAQLHKHFEWGDKNSVRGEATPIYCYWPPSLERIHAYNADAKIIMLLRHPAHRAYSQWRMEFQRGDETLQFADVISESGRSRVPISQGSVHRVYSYIERGFYSKQIKRLKGFFGDNQLLFMRTDELWSKPQPAIDKITHFLEVGLSRGNASGYVAPMTLKSHAVSAQHQLPHLIDQLTQLYTEDIHATERLTGISLADWLDPCYSEPMPRA